MKNKKEVYFKNVRREEIIENIYSEKNHGKIGHIYFDGEDYWFKPVFFFTSWKLGKGKCLKEVAERLIELNYKNQK